MKIFCRIGVRIHLQILNDPKKHILSSIAKGKLFFKKFLLFPYQASIKDLSSNLLVPDPSVVAELTSPNEIKKTLTMFSKLGLSKTKHIKILHHILWKPADSVAHWIDLCSRFAHFQVWFSIMSEEPWMSESLFCSHSTLLIHF